MQFNLEPPDSLAKLNSRRKVVRVGGKPIFYYAVLSADERKTLIQAAKERGLLTRYEFCGIARYGVSRNHAASLLLEDTHHKAFELLRRAFGACARFWVRPKQLRIIGIDFYWKKANMGLALTGPLIDDPSRGDPGRTRDSRPALEYDIDSMIPQSMKGLMVVKMPYYLVWHQSSDFLRRIRSKLFATGRYPGLREER